MFDNLHDAQTRLIGTIIRYNKRPVYVADVRGAKEKAKGPGDMVMDLVYLKTQTKANNIPLDDAKVNYKSIPLGYVNQFGDAFYLSRMPARMWKQGVCRENLNAKGGRTRFNLSHGPLAKTVDKVYPSMQICLERVLNQDAYAMAWCRVFAVSTNRNEIGDPSLDYKGDTVGVFKNGQPVLNPQFKYLKEELEESLQ